MFEQLLGNLKTEVVKFLSHVQIQRPDEAQQIEQQRREAAEREKLAFQHAQASGLALPGAGDDPAQRPEPTPQTFTRDQPKVGRNEPCPCGSGKKYKQCHGKL